MTEPEAIHVLVNLTLNEIERAAMTGMERRIRELEDGVHREDGWELHINAAIGELVMAKMRDRDCLVVRADEEPNPPEI